MTLNSGSSCLNLWSIVIASLWPNIWFVQCWMLSIEPRALQVLYQLSHILGSYSRFLVLKICFIPLTSFSVFVFLFWFNFVPSKKIKVIEFEAQVKQLSLSLCSLSRSLSLFPFFAVSVSLCFCLSCLCECLCVGDVHTHVCILVYSIGFSMVTAVREALK